MLQPLVKDTFILVFLFGSVAALATAGCSQTAGTPGTNSSGGSPGHSGGATGRGGSTGTGGFSGGTDTGGGSAGGHFGNSETGGSGADGGTGATGGIGGGGGTGPGGQSSTGGAAGAGVTGTGGGTQKPRVVVMTDISNEPDDEESLVRFLVYSNEFDVEAMIAVTSTFLRTAPREDLIRRDITAYNLVRPNLLKHAAGFPDAVALAAVTKTGQPGFGMAFVGAGKASAGSTQLIAAVDKPDPRPLWITGWGGNNTLAQALTDVRATRTAAQLGQFIAKLRVYTTSDQDDAGPWMRMQFPDLFYVVSPSSVGSADFPRATWTGISGDRFYKNGPMYQFDLVDNPWLLTNIIQNHGPLGALYPQLKYIMEGDTPTWLGLVNNGLGSSINPGYGGWGGRYVFAKLATEPHAIWTNNSAGSSDTFTYAPGMTAISDQATIWRWRDHYQYDFATRMNWCVADAFAKANHNPAVVLNGDMTKDILTIAAKGGDIITLTANGTSDPDSNSVTLKWWTYPEAGTITGATLSADTGSQTDVHLPAVQTSGSLHVILQAEDNGTPHLFAYRRIILNVSP